GRDLGGCRHRHSGDPESRNLFQLRYRGPGISLAANGTKLEQAAGRENQRRPFGRVAAGDRGWNLVRGDEHFDIARGLPDDPSDLLEILTILVAGRVNDDQTAFDG